MFSKYMELYNEYNFGDNVDDLYKINKFNKEKIEQFNLKKELNDTKKRIEQYVKNNITDEDVEMECSVFINSIVERKTMEESFKRMILQKYEILEIDHNNVPSVIQTNLKNKTTIKFEKYSDSEGSWDTYLYINDIPIERYCKISNKDEINIVPLVELYDIFGFKHMTYVRFLFLILNLCEPDVTEYTDEFNCTKLVNNICQHIVDKHIKKMLLANNLEYEIKSIIKFDYIEDENEINVDTPDIYFRKIKFIYFVLYFFIFDNKLMYVNDIQIQENKKNVIREEFSKIENGMIVLDEHIYKTHEKIIEKMKLKSLDDLQKIMDIIVGVLIGT